MPSEHPHAIQKVAGVSPLLGPAITGASTGKIYQAGLSYGTNVIMLQATGKTTSEHMLDILNSKEQQGSEATLKK